MWENIQQMRDTLQDFHSRINQAKANVEAMNHIMEVTDGRPSQAGTDRLLSGQKTAYLCPVHNSNNNRLIYQMLKANYPS